MTNQDLTVEPWTATRRVGEAIRAQRPLDVAVYSIVFLLLVLAVVGPSLAPENVNQSELRNALQPPSVAHWFGTDDQGRDILWRVVSGARVSILSSLLIVGLYSLIGVAIAIAATVGGTWVDAALMGATDVVLAIPKIVVALALAAALGAGLQSAIIAMVLVGWPVSARLLRGIMRQTVEQPFVAGARVLGVSGPRLMTRHVLPNSLDILYIKWAGDVGQTIVLLGALSFLGVGAQPPSPEWGAMVADARGYVATAWWAVAAPGLALTVAAAAFGLLGEILQTRNDPSLRQ